MVKTKNKAIFVDMDGTISKLPVRSGDDRLYKIEDFEEVPGSFEALKKLKDKGFYIIVVTNQGGIAKGIYCEEDHLRITKHIKKEAEKQGAKIDAIYFCPFHERAKVKKYQHDNHPDRKPNPGMLNKAIKKFSVDPKESYMIGDHISDMGAGENAGVCNIFVLSGYGQKYREQLSTLKKKPLYIASDLKDAADWILTNEKTQD